MKVLADSHMYTSGLAINMMSPCIAITEHIHILRNGIIIIVIKLQYAQLAMQLFSCMSNACRYKLNYNFVVYLSNHIFNFNSDIG